MKNKRKVLNGIMGIVGIIVVAGVIIVSPSLYFQLQEKELLNREKELPIEVLKLEKNKQEELNLEQRREMVYKEEKDVEMISLKTGDRYSLYEARRQCYRELRKIPVLKMDLYGPVQKEIDISPVLMVDAKIPAYSLIIWRGSLTIKDVRYEVVLDEESGKLLGIHGTDEAAAGDGEVKLQETLEKEWEKYFYH